MQHVTFDTAKRLKEAGFPQPEPAFGQVWYDQNKMECLVVEGDIMKNVWTARPGADYGERVHIGTLKRNYTFAPNATDILEQINTGPQEQDGWFIGPGGFVGEYICQDGFTRSERNDNPAEACAAAWLKLREPKPDLDPNYLPW